MTSDIIITKSSFLQLVLAVGMQEACEVAREQGITLAVCQIWVRSYKRI